MYPFKGSSNPALPGVGTQTGLDAGSAITVMNGNTQGQLTTSASKPGQYAANFSFAAGTYTFTGPGGKDVGSFNVNLAVPVTGLAWTNQTSVSPIQRGSGVTVTWTGADPNGTVLVSGFSVGGINQANAVGAGFTCTAPSGAGQFTVPATVLLAQPPSGNFSSSILTVPTGSLGVSTSSLPVAFSATGLDFGFATATVAISNSTFAYQ